MTDVRRDKARPKPLTDDAALRAAVNEVDRTLIRWMLGLTPLERLAACSNAAQALHRYRRGASS